MQNILPVSDLEVLLPGVELGEVIAVKVSPVEADCVGRVPEVVNLLNPLTPVAWVGVVAGKRRNENVFSFILNFKKHCK